MKQISNQKKPTKGELEKAIKSAVVFVPKERDMKTVFFDDKGLRLTVTDDYAIIETGYHRHVFNAFTVSGISRPYLYTKRFAEIALENDCTVTKEKGGTGRSYAKLMSVLKAKEDHSEYNICWFIDLWFFNIFTPLYDIDETEGGAFVVYEQYIHNVARQFFMLDEHKEDVTNKQYVNAIIAKEKEYMEEIPEKIIFKAKSDEERMQEEIAAIQEQEVEQQIAEEQADGQQVG